ncbi:phosphatidate cytidylyltransferase [Fructobacillus pseudoficulneus]|uniref:Phosphatidate cytidylyltransferase n=1 Tax=Fructobacillus pseudoficulneus TaxID=220714 RepID=A0A3F3H263_9LACO|nr:phosphatidate cytidylyltransferase [Fructobacillus pseudoficulneus]GAP02260.1 phosphatidate cytidylyltransferase [Fructobacillus pseudoficulneus]SEH36222.1 phosphatidate cytidylyltransferase [Fructobacillus pseudoficulneus]
MKTRIITAVVALLVFVPLVIIGKLPLLVLTILLGMVAMSEVLRMTHTLLVSFEATISYIGVIAIILPKNFWLNDFWPSTVNSQTVIYGLAFLFLARTVFAKKSFNFQDAGTLYLAMVYIGTGFHYFYQADYRGLPVLFFGLLTVWLTDSFAYFVGKAFGQHKLSPRLSPNKTWEGSVGGSVIAIVVVVILYVSTGWLEYNALDLAIFALILSLAGQIGDLIESALKRHFRVKDSGRILPGHGGILDRFDSMLVVMPLMAVLGMLK